MLLGPHKLGPRLLGQLVFRPQNFKPAIATTRADVMPIGTHVGRAVWCRTLRTREPSNLEFYVLDNLRARIYLRSAVCAKNKVRDGWAVVKLSVRSSGFVFGGFHMNASPSVTINRQLVFCCVNFNFLCHASGFPPSVQCASRGPRRATGQPYYRVESLNQHSDFT